MITDLGHAAFGVHDLERALAFYRHLGIDESFRLNHEDGSLMLVYLHIAGDRFIELFPNGPAPDPARVQSFRHICLVVDDLEATVADPRGKGIAIEIGSTLSADSESAWKEEARWLDTRHGTPCPYVPGVPGHRAGCQDGLFRQHASGARKAATKKGPRHDAGASSATVTRLSR